MRKGLPQIEIKARAEKDVLLEYYTYSAGWWEPLPVHVHTEFQFALCVNLHGSYYYRGSRVYLPTKVLAVLHSGEPHSSGENHRTLTEFPSHYLMMYIEPQVMLAHAGEVTTRPISALPYFPQILIEDESLLTAYTNLFRSMNRNELQIERDVAELSFFAQLITRHSQNHSALPKFKANPGGVNRAIEYLHSNFASDLSLDDLASVAGISKFHFVRAFRKQIGITPNKYLQNLRIGHAKRMLLRGLTVAETAAQTGFYDESHFGKYFKHIVGASPGSYAR